MAKASSTSSSKPWAALAAVALIAASEGLFHATASDPHCGAPLLEPIVDDAALMVKRELIAKTGGAIVLAGDSSCLTGLRARELEAALKVPVINLGTLSSHTTHGYADFVEDALAHSPKMIVLALLPQSIELAEWRVRIFKTYPRHLLATGRRNPLLPLDLRDHVELFRHRHEFNVFPPEFGGSFARYRNDLLSENGWYPEKKKYGKPDFERREFEPVAFSEAGVERLIQKAIERDRPVYLLWSPHPADAVSEQYQREVREWTKQLQLRCPKLKIIRETVPAWPASDFGSVTHLTPQGASKNTAELVQMLSK